MVEVHPQSAVRRGGSQHGAVNKEAVSSRTQPSANRAAAILRLADISLGRTQTALGAFYRRLAVRIDKPQANTAMARKLAILVYRALKGELVYRDPGRWLR